MIMTVKTYWSQLHDRERMMLLVAIVCCVSYLLYALVYSPLASAVNRATVQLAEEQTTLTWMQAVRQQNTHRQVTHTVNNGQLLTILGNQLNRTSFHPFPYQLGQTGSGDIQLSFDDVPYHAFVSWLWKLSEQYGFSIKQLNIERTKTPGVVKVLVVVSALP